MELTSFDNDVLPKQASCFMKWLFEICHMQIGPFKGNGYIFRGDNKFVLSPEKGSTL